MDFYYKSFIIHFVYIFLIRINSNPSSDVARVNKDSEDLQNYYRDDFHSYNWLGQFMELNIKHKYKITYLLSIKMKTCINKNVNFIYTIGNSFVLVFYSIAYSFLQSVESLE